MTDHEKRASERVPVALRIRLRYHAVDQFISKFAVNISRGGMFLSSRNPKPPGTELYFEIRLADESPVIEGSGEVRWIREYDRRRPDEPHGMGIEFLELSEESWPVLDRIIEHRRHIGEHDDNSIPEPRASERARNPIDTADPGYAPRDATSPWPGPDPRDSHGADHEPEPPRDRQEAAPRRPLPIGSIDAPLEEAPPARGNGSDRAGTDEDLRRELMRVLAPAVLLTSGQPPAPSGPPEPDQEDSIPLEPDHRDAGPAYGQESGLIEPDHGEDSRFDSARLETSPAHGQESGLDEPERSWASDESGRADGQESGRAEPARRDASRAPSDESGRADGQESGRGEPERRDASRAEPERRDASRAEPERRDASRAEPEHRDASRAEPERRDASRAEPERRDASRAEPEHRDASRASRDESRRVSAQESNRPAPRPDGRRSEAPRAQPSRPRASSRGVEPPVVRAAVARARALTSDVHVETELDRELAELLEESAVPVEITVEAASRELAERLGGAPVERRRARTDRADRTDPSPMATRAMSLDEALSDDVDPDDRPVRGHAPEPIAGESHAARLLRKS